ncbi:MAG TPA: TRAP transporter small permease subunit [Candidatus Methylomirabilis sp.]|nr:TRAP transporter small permease subunit [Candidatus Methylomirabilis sp.]
MQSAIHGYFRLLQFLLKALVGLLLNPVTLQIASRYTGWIPRYIWTEEAARFLFIWIVMIGASIAIGEDTHFRVDVLPRPTRRWARIGSRVVVDLAYLAMAAVFVVSGYRYAEFGYIQTSERTGINMIAIHGVFLLAGVTWLIFIAERMFSGLRPAGGGDYDGR